LLDPQVALHSVMTLLLAGCQLQAVSSTQALLFCRKHVRCLVHCVHPR